MDRKALGNRHPDTLILTPNNLGVLLLLDKGDLAAAEPLLFAKIRLCSTR